MDLRYLTDEQLLKDTDNLISRERKLSAELLHHFKEIERRKLYSDLGYSSLFDYLVRKMRYSEAAATRRIQAARLLADLPELKEKIESGSLSLSNLSKTAFHFKKENISSLELKKEILSRVENISARECDKVLLGQAPSKPLPRELLKIVAFDTYTLKMNISESTRDKLQEVELLLSKKKLSQGDLLDFILTIALEKLRNNKFHLNAKQTPTSGSHGNTRYIPHKMKKEVYERDKGFCQICGSKNFLEYDHQLPFALGGKSTKENLRLLCSSCNQRARIRSKL